MVRPILEHLLDVSDAMVELALSNADAAGPRLDGARSGPGTTTWSSGPTCC